MLDILFQKLKPIVPERWHWVLEHSGFKRYFANTGWMFFGQMFSIISVLVNIWVARYLGPSDFGKLSYALAFAGMFSFIANLGVSGILVRDLVKYPEQRDKLMGTAFVLTLGGGILAFLIATIGSFIFISDILVRNLAIVFALTFIFSSVNIIANFFQATVQAKKNSQIQITVIIISSLIKIYLIFTGKGIIWLITVFLFDYILYNILYIFNYFKSGLKIFDWKFDKNIAKEIFSISWLLMLSSAAAYIYMKIDQVMIGYYLNTTAVGLYAAAVRLAEIWYFIPGIICSSLLPAIINAKKYGEEKYKRRLKNLYILLGGIAVLIAIPSTLFASWFINLFFGSAYGGSVIILQIYVWSGVGLFLTWGLNQYFLTENRLYAIFNLSFFSMILNILLNIIFIPKFGLTGAAWATLISYSIGPVLILSFSKIKKIN
mgnify:CR=1 FL=1